MTDDAPDFVLGEWGTLGEMLKDVEGDFLPQKVQGLIDSVEQIAKERDELQISSDYNHSTAVAYGKHITEYLADLNSAKLKLSKYEDSLPAVKGLVYEKCEFCASGRIPESDPMYARDCTECDGEGEVPVKCEMCGGKGDVRFVKPTDSDELHKWISSCPGHNCTNGYATRDVAVLPGMEVWWYTKAGYLGSYAVCGLNATQLKKSDHFWVSCGRCFADSLSAKLLGGAG